METLDGTEWDVVISDTGFVSSLLALSLSRSGKRILHLDKNDYYGGNEAALSLSEAEEWASRVSQDDGKATFSHASATKHDVDTETKLSSSRAYSLALAPHLVYARSKMVPALVSSRSHNQLDFQAVGSWFVVSADSESQPRLIRVPSGREDVFQDSSLDIKAKRSLMRFLRFVASYEEQAEVWQDSKDLPFPTFLQQKFGLPPASHGAILALTMSQTSPQATSTASSLPRIARHLRSIGIFGPGFGAVLPKWGGLAEIAQVVCRACAVGGGVYVLNKSIKNVERKASDGGLSLELSDGEKVSTRWLCGATDKLPTSTATSPADYSTTTASRSMFIISSPLPSLFPPTSEGGVTPAGAVVVIPSSDEHAPPVHLLVHTSDAGECPMSQSVIYASTALPQDQGYPRLEQAVSALLSSVKEAPTPEILWTLRYSQRASASQQVELELQDGIIALPPLSRDLALEDFVLESVKQAWQKIMGESEEAFMRFEARAGGGDDDDEG